MNVSAYYKAPAASKRIDCTGNPAPARGSRGLGALPDAQACFLLLLFFSAVTESPSTHFVAIYSAGQVPAHSPGYPAGLSIAHGMLCPASDLLPSRDAWVVSVPSSSRIICRGLPSPLQPRSRSHLSLVLCRLNRTEAGRDEPAPPCVLGAMSPENTGLSACFPNLLWPRVHTTTHWAGPVSGRACPGGAGRWGEAGDTGSGEKNTQCVFCTPAVKHSVPFPHQGSRSPQPWAISTCQAGAPVPCPWPVGRLILTSTQ